MIPALLARHWRVLLVMAVAVAITLGIYAIMRKVAATERENVMLERTVKGQAATIEQLTRDAILLEQAAIQRRSDTTRIDAAKDEVIGEIRKAPDASPGAARIALGCSRLRKAGTRADRLPAACRFVR